MINSKAGPSPKAPREMNPEELRIYKHALHQQDLIEKRALLQRYRANQKWFDSFNDARVPAFG